MQLDQEELAIMTKGKRSKRQRSVSPLALTMAELGSATSDVVPGELARDKDHHREEEEEDMANCLILLAKGQTSQKPPRGPALAQEVYQCKTCDKSFPLFQALGGHSASHKKPSKPLTLEENNMMKSLGHDDLSTVLSLRISTRVLGNPQGKSSGVHECSICGAEFGSGQALGGHMRRHRPVPVAVARGGEPQEAKRIKNNLLSLDLNLPAPEDDHHHDHEESKFPFARKDKVIVFSASPLVDCHY